MFLYLTYFGRTQDGKLDDLSSEGSCLHRHFGIRLLSKTTNIFSWYCLSPETDVNPIPNQHKAGTPIT